MKKNVLSIGLFVVAFIATYLYLCYCIPGWRIKLEAEPFAYFIESVKSLFLVKAMISFVLGGIVGAIPVLIRKIGRK